MLLTSDIAISVRGLSKSYTIAHDQEKHVTLAEKALARLKNPLSRVRTETFWALKDINFDIKKGDVVGIIGRNGAGKSTLLKILSRITEPTTGAIDLYGRVGSLLEVGTGFHPELTGRENIFLNGAILGMTKSEIRKQFDAIVDFAGVEQFLDTPVKRYSSGMYVRLAFAVAAHLESEILIVDEVLAVGDAEFQKKCLGKMSEVARHGRTVMFVSHNMAAVATLCNRAIFLAKGSVELQGPADEVLNRYIEAGRKTDGCVVWTDPATRPGDGKLELLSVQIYVGTEVTGDVEITQDIDVCLTFRTRCPDLRVSASIHLLDKMGACIFATINMPSASLSPDPMFNVAYPVGVYRTVCRIPRNFLNEGIYMISAFLLTNVSNIDVQALEAVQFTVHDTGEMRKEYQGAWIGMIRPKMAWHTARVDDNSADDPFKAPIGAGAVDCLKGSL